MSLSHPRAAGLILGMKSPLRFLLPLALVAIVGVANDADAGARARRISVDEISKHVVKVGDVAMMPVADLARATGCELVLVTKSGSKTEPAVQSWVAWPCEGGVLEVDEKNLKIAGKVAPGAAQGFDPQPDPPAELRIGTSLVSRRIAVQSGDPHLPVAEVARLMGGKLEVTKAGAFIVVPRKAEAVLRVAAR